MQHRLDGGRIARLPCCALYQIISYELIGQMPRPSYSVYVRCEVHCLCLCLKIRYARLTCYSRLAIGREKSSGWVGANASQAGLGAK